MRLTWYPGVVVVPILVEFFWVEVRGEVSPIGSWAREVEGVAMVRVVGRVDVVDGGSPTVGRPRGGRDHPKRTVET